jgi:AraC-like DNA-binding protein
MSDFIQLPRITPELLRGSAPWRHSGPMRFSLGAEPENERAPLLREFFERLRVPYTVNHPDDAPLEVDLAMHALPGLKISSGRMNWSRSLRVRTKDSSDDIALIVNRKGPYIIEQDGDELELGDGEAAFVSFSDPCSYTHRPPGQLLTLSVPRTQFAPLVMGGASRTMRRIPAGAPGLRLLMNYVETSWDARATSNSELGHLMVTHIHDLMALLIGATRDGVERAQAGGVRAARLAAIKQDIARNLDQQGLSVAVLAARHGCTPRFVQRLFEAEGTTFTEYVLAQRLARAFRALTDPRRAGEKISVVAYDVGFGDLSYFNRAFRRHYGAAPSDVRTQVRLPN